MSYLQGDQWTVFSADLLRPILQTLIKQAHHMQVCICPDRLCFESTCDTIIAVWRHLIPEDELESEWKR